MIVAAPLPCLHAIVLFTIIEHSICDHRSVMSILIEASALQELLVSEFPVILDCRYDLADPESGLRRYREGHIPGAHYVALDRDCCAKVGVHGGRHPLPTIAEMASLFGKLGIERTVTPVVCLDDDDSCFAAHVWWMLRYLGHDVVRVLQGGQSAWRRIGGALTTDISESVETAFHPLPQPHMLADMDQVRNGDRMLLVDCRTEERYRGEHETIDPVAGHIPGAINIPWRDLVTDDGRFCSVGVLADKLTGIDERSVVYCGSGVTACVAVLAAAEAGLGLPRLYAGGWSDWITWKGNPVATG
jgi:thiosulfate/3-mercaptopyruvate sulfurtransferase